MRRGRPILVAFRVPDSVPYCRDIGLDVEDWRSKGWVDLLATAGYFQMNTWETSVALARKYGVKCYASLDESRVPDPEAKKLRMTPAAYRGRVLNALDAGMDGVYLFNSFDPHNPIWREIGDRGLISTKDQDYFASVRGLAGAAGNAYPHRPFQNIPTLNPKAPVQVAPGKAATVPLRVGNAQLSKIEPALIQTTLRLQFKALPVPDSASVFLNGKSLSAPKMNDRWMEFPLDPHAVRTGINEVRVETAADAAPLEWWDLHLQFRYASP
jgi:hypothetical protein